MSLSRKGLRRAGLRSYLVDGPLGAFLIERERPALFTVRKHGFPRDFLNGKFKRLWQARTAAEGWAGIELTLPSFLARRPMIDIRDQISEQPRAHFGVIYADPPWYWKPWKDYADTGGKANIARSRAVEKHYDTLTIEELAALPVAEIAAENSILFMWTTWPLLRRSFEVIDGWGFTYKTIGFDWMKADVSTIDLFPDPKSADMTLGFWTRSNSEPCLLATRGKPKRLHADVRMGIIEPRRQHSRKPSCVYSRIERLVAGPYLEMFGRTNRQGWTVLGNEVGKFREVPCESPL